VSSLRKWTYRVAAVYGALALAVVAIGVGTMENKNTLEVNSARSPNHASSALSP
jgi:hypothetical protein